MEVEELTFVVRLMGDCLLRGYFLVGWKDGKGLEWGRNERWLMRMRDGCSGGWREGGKSGCVGARRLLWASSNV